MKLNDKSLQWIYDNCEALKKAIVALDYCKQSKIAYSENRTYQKAISDVKGLAFSFLMVAMGEHIPKTLWSVSDYSVLYGLLDDHKDELEITQDE